MRRIRIGIDVGGTFTDAAAIDENTWQLVATVKTFTTHAAQNGVAEGIVTVLRELLAKGNIDPAEVVFIAHGTTQATNALLEGDVAQVGILTIADGFWRAHAAALGRVEPLELAAGRVLKPDFCLVPPREKEIGAGIDALAQNGATSLAVTAPFAVDDTLAEERAVALARQQGLFATCGHEVSKLYGMAARTRTAVINAALLPKMVHTADMTDKCVRQAEIPAPLMVMRCDGGVMSVDEVRRRPMLTMLSGPAAAVAGALRHGGLSNGIFLESGGTSTDISAIKNGRVMVKNVRIGGHQLFMRGLDVRTVGVAGGSMVRLRGKKMVGTGPRSAHIAGLAYEVFSPPVENGVIELLAPVAGDEQIYVAVKGADGRRVALTLCGAANILGYVPAGDYASGDIAAAKAAWQALADALAVTVETAARKCMELALREVEPVVAALTAEYQLPGAALVGGGGSASVVSPALAEKLARPCQLVKDAPLISTIGVALAMLREVVERTVPHPTEEDLASIRREATDRLLVAGAAPETIAVSITVDSRSGILRAEATGATAAERGDGREWSADERRRAAAEVLVLPADGLDFLGQAGQFMFWQGVRKLAGGFFGAKRELVIAAVNRLGQVVLSGRARCWDSWPLADVAQKLPECAAQYTMYGTVGGQVPPIMVFAGEKQIDLTGLGDIDRMLAVVKLETAGLPGDATVAAVVL